MNTKPIKLVLMRRVGDMTILRRNPKPRGMRAFIVARGEIHLEEFGRYAKAVRWAKDNKFTTSAAHPSGLSGEHDEVLDAINKESLHQ